jgi:hypothetical protein
LSCANNPVATKKSKNRTDFFFIIQGLDIITELNVVIC